MAIIIALPMGVVAAVITTAEYILSTIAALSARATLHGVWLLGLHRGGEAALDSRTRTRRALKKDFASFLLTIFLVIAAASVESNLEPGWMVQRFAINPRFCVSPLGRFAPMRVQAHSPPFRVGIEPWVFKSAQHLNCAHGIASLGVGSWTDVKGHKMDMLAPTCVNKSLNLASKFLGVRASRYRFTTESFNTVIGKSPMYTLFPLKVKNLGKNIREIGTALEGKGECGRRGISGYYMGMNANYETMRMHAKNMTFGVHERMCVAHGEKVINPLSVERVRNCYRRGQKEIELKCILQSAREEEKYSIRLPDMAALYGNGKTKDASYACIEGVVQVEYLFLTADLANEFRPSTPNLNENGASKKPNGPPTLPVLLPTSVRSISGRCQQTIAPIAQSALLFSTEQEWWNLEFAKVDRQIRFHAYMMAVSDSLFPLPNLPTPESSLNNGTCYARPVEEVTQIPWTWASIFFMACVCLVATVTLSAFIFRIFFRGESWLVGSARWSLNRLLGDGEGEGQTEKETTIQAVPVSPPADKHAHRVSSSFILGKRGSVNEPVDWKYEFRFRTRDGVGAATRAAIGASIPISLGSGEGNKSP